MKMLFKPVLPPFRRANEAWANEAFEAYCRSNYYGAIQIVSIPPHLRIPLQESLRESLE